MLARSHCDVMLIDGDHTQKGVAGDLFIMSTVASRSSMVVIDDIGEPMWSKVILKFIGERRIELVEKHGPYHANDTKNNPCMPYPKQYLEAGKAHRCTFWGFALLRYVMAEERNDSAPLFAPRLWEPLVKER